MCQKPPINYLYIYGFLMLKITRFVVFEHTKSIFQPLIHEWNFVVSEEKQFIYKLYYGIF